MTDSAARSHSGNVRDVPKPKTKAARPVKRAKAKPAPKRSAPKAKAKPAAKKKLAAKKPTRGTLDQLDTRAAAAVALAIEAERQLAASTAAPVATAGAWLLSARPRRTHTR